MLLHQLNLKNHILCLGKLAIALSPALIIILSSASVQSFAPPSAIETSLQFPTAMDRGTPQRTIGGGARGNYLISQGQIIN
jgi:hypothetical protein